MKQKAFLICPVRSGVPDELMAIIPVLDEKYDLHFPPRDTNQDDMVGVNICTENYEAIKSADVILIWFDPTSKGTLFDIGMSFALKKPIIILNDIESTPAKSFSNVLLNWPHNE